MACKTVKKKAAYKRHCREQVRQGLFNDELGNWRPEGQLNTNQRAMFRDCRAGYNFR